MKGAQERVLERCTHDVIDGNVVALTPKERANVVRRQEALSATGCAALASPSLSSTAARSTHARAGASCSLAYPITDQAIACKVVILWSTSPQ
jgi:magnesium-transporting ATPase (P-type)